jgi:hypothetical protein
VVQLVVEELERAGGGLICKETGGEVVEGASGKVWIGGEGCQPGARVEDMGRGRQDLCVQVCSYDRLRGEWGWMGGGRRRCRGLTVSPSRKLRRWGRREGQRR